MTQIHEKSPRPILSLRRPGKVEMMSILGCLVVLGVIGLRTWARMERNERRNERIAAEWGYGEDTENSAEVPKKSKPKRVLTPEQKEERDQATRALGTLQRLETRAARFTTVAKINEEMNTPEVREAKRDYEDKLAKLHPDDAKSIKQSYVAHSEAIQYQIRRAEEKDSMIRSLSEHKRQRDAGNISFRPPPELRGNSWEPPEPRGNSWEPPSPPPEISHESSTGGSAYDALLQAAHDEMTQSREEAQHHMDEIAAHSKERFANSSSKPSNVRSATPVTEMDELLPIARKPESNASAAVETSEDLSDPRIAARADFLRRDIPLPVGGVAALYEVRWSLEKGNGSGKFMLGIYDVPDDRNFRGKIFLAGNPEKFNRDFSGKVTYKPNVEYPISIDLDTDSGVAASDCRNVILRRFFQAGATINDEKSTNIRLKIDGADITGFSKNKTVRFTLAKLTKAEVQEIIERNAK